MAATRTDPPPLVERILKLFLVGELEGDLVVLDSGGNGNGVVVYDDYRRREKRSVQEGLPSRAMLEFVDRVSVSINEWHLRCALTLD